MSTQHASPRPSRSQAAPRNRRAGSSRPAAGSTHAASSTTTRTSKRTPSSRTRTSRLDSATPTQTTGTATTSGAKRGSKRGGTSAAGKISGSTHKTTTRVKKARTEEHAQQHRTPLAATNRRTHRLSPPTMLAVFAAIPLTLIFILLLNVLIVTRQYDMVDLRAQEQRLVQENQALHQEIGFKEAPQDLAIRASTLGMFVSSSQATLNLKTATIEGTPAPVASPTGAAAAKEDNLVAPPAAGSEESYAKSIVDANRAVQKRHSPPSASANASAIPSAQGHGPERS